MPKFTKRLRGIFSNAHGKENDIKPTSPRMPPSLPILPAQRGHDLTPRASRRNITELPDGNGIIFDRLPRELRDQIYTAAFGNRTVHMDLRLTHPLLPDPSSALTHAQRLAAITSLELIWDLLTHRPTENEYHYYVSGYVPGKPWPLYEALMEKVPYAFPCIKKLLILVEATSYIADLPNEAIGASERRLLEPADALVRSLEPQLRDFQIAPNASLYRALARRAMQNGAISEKGGTGATAWKRFWRTAAVAGWPPDHVGYWVRQGKDDTPVW
ncbi:MAG: hypothetical protein Q9213_000575 [Squamulea squamosa]